MRNVAIIGMGRFGAALALELSAQGVEVLAVDEDEESVRVLPATITSRLVLDATDAVALEALGVDELDAVVVAIGEGFEATQECVLALKRLGARHIVARGQAREYQRILKKIGADRVVSPEEESAKRVAHVLTHPLMLDTVDLGDDIHVATVAVPPALVGKVLRDLHPTTEFQVLVLRVTRFDEAGVRLEAVIPASADTDLRERDQLTLFGRSEAIRRFAQL